jgi:hypothetical protein
LTVSQIQTAIYTLYAPLHENNRCAQIRWTGVKPSYDVTASGTSLSLPQLELSGTGSKTGSIAERGEAVRASMHTYFDNTWAITEVRTQCIL